MKPPRSQDPAQWLEDFRVNGDCATQQMVWCGSLGDTFDLPILSAQPCLQALPPQAWLCLGWWIERESRSSLASRLVGDLGTCVPVLFA